MGLAAHALESHDDLWNPLGLVRAASMRSADARIPGAFRLDALRGRLVELVGGPGSAALTRAARLALDAQHLREPVAWIVTPGGSFFPPDLARNGVDLAAMPLIRTHDAEQAAAAAVRLLRSAAFGLLVLDLSGDAELSTPAQARLVKLAQAHDAAVVFLTPRPLRIGSLVSLRVEARRTRATTARFRITLTATKDKSAGPGWTDEELAHGPHGLA